MQERKKQYLLHNGKGGFDITTELQQSRYFGTFFRDGEEVFKVFEPIHVNSQVITSTYQHHSVVFKRENDIEERHFMPKGFAAKVIEMSREDWLPLTLDIKKLFDNREWGRMYEVEQQEDTLVITYIKSTDWREDKSTGEEEYKRYVVVKAEKPEFQIQKTWVRKYYDFDHKRNSPPLDRYVFFLGQVRTKRMVLCYGSSKEKALEECLEVFTTYRKLLEKEKKQVDKMYTQRSFFNRETEYAYYSSVYHLQHLLQHHQFAEEEGTGFIAGLPWFSQVWSRDDCIALGALLQLGQLREVKQTLFKYLKLITADGRIPSRFFPPSNLSSADAVGILFLRLGQWVELVHAHKKKSLLSTKERDEVVSCLDHVIFLHRKYHVKGNLCYNKPLETWMDTNAGSDNREGYRIEIQALLMHMYKMMHDLAEGEHGHKYLDFELELKKELRKKFWNESILADGLNDFTVRPNIFLAAYYFYDMFQKEDWKICFKIALEKLWLDWGGLSTIEKNHFLFQQHYTGENNASYHRGDSWFYINNIAAMMLYKTDKELFAPYIQKIVEASTKDILEFGIVGAASELSSAENQDASGCLCQTWSLATYVEMVHFLNIE